MRFSGPIRYEVTADNRRRLTSPLSYRTHDGREITVPVEYITDGFTTPWFIWMFYPKYGPGVEAAAVHDYLLTHLSDEYTRRQADRVFREALKDTGDAGFVDRWVLWTGVRIGALQSWMRDKYERIRQSLTIGDW